MAELMLQHLRDEVERQAVRLVVGEIMDSVYETGYVQAWSAHPVWHLWYVLHGRALVSIREASFVAHQGEFFLIPGGTPHALAVPPPEACHMFDVKFDCVVEPMPGAGATSALGNILGLDHALHGRDDCGLQPLIESLLLEGQLRRPAWQNAVRGMFEEILSLVVRRLTAAAPSGPETCVGRDLWPVAIRRAVEFIEEHYPRPVRLRDIAAHAGLSPKYLVTSFRTTVGCTPWEFLVRTRIRAARGLLASGELLVKEVARRAGFESIQHFSRTFRRRVGLSPSAYRRRFGTIPARASKT